MAKPKKEVERIVKTTIRVPASLWDRIRIRAIEEHLTAEAIVVTALQQYLGGN